MAELVLLTGANGHLGSNTVRFLLEKGYKVRAFVRKSSNLEGIKDLDVEIAFGDIFDKSSVVKAVKGCKFVIHQAAVYKLQGITAEEIMEPALIGTRNVIEASAEEGVERLVYTSSTIAIGNTDVGSQMLNEENWNQEQNVPYGIAKTESEKEAWKLSKELDLPLIVINPAIIFGKFDYSITPSNTMIKNIAKGFFMTAKSVMSFVDVKDAAEIHVLALKQGSVGERYIAVSQLWEMKRLAQEVGKITGRRVIHSPVPRNVNIFLCLVLEKTLKLFGIATPLPTTMVREYSHRYANHDNSKVKRDFDFEFRKMEDTIRETVSWLVERNEIKLSKKAMERLVEAS